MEEETHEMVERFGLDIDVTRPIGDYPVATRQLLELAIATHRKARFLLLDEPTTSLEGDQIDELLEKIRDHAHNEGVGIMRINHKLDELYAVADHIVALVDGQVRINGPLQSIAREEVVRAITGAEVDAPAPAPAQPSPATEPHPPRVDASTRPHSAGRR